MKPIAALSSLALTLATFTLCIDASADPNARPGTTRGPVTTKTADYAEQQLGGDQVVTFTCDELIGAERGAYGDVIRQPPGVTRVGLIKPRMNFVSELLKTVENI